MSIDITTLALAKEYTNRMVGSGGTGGGVNGKDGITPHIGDNGNWFIGTVDTGVSAQGPAGENGVTPHIGTNGNWYIGSVNTGVSAKGVKGDNGLDGNGIKSAILNSDYTLTLTFDDGTTYTTPSIRGATGDAGSAGKNGTDGKDGSDGVGIASIKQTTTSTADGGNNVFTVTLTNGTTATFIVKNGSKGSTGKDGSNGVDGGHYTPVVTQPTTDTMQISFAPSKSDMPAVNPVTVNLPVSENSGQNANDYAALNNKPSINGVELNGNKTAADLGIEGATDEQISAGVNAWLNAHPEAVTTVENNTVGIGKLTDVGGYYDYGTHGPRKPFAVRNNGAKSDGECVYIPVKLGDTYSIRVAAGYGTALEFNHRYAVGFDASGAKIWSNAITDGYCVQYTPEQDGYLAVNTAYGGATAVVHIYKDANFDIDEAGDAYHPKFIDGLFGLPIKPALEYDMYMQERIRQINPKLVYKGYVTAKKIEWLTDAKRYDCYLYIGPKPHLIYDDIIEPGDLCWSMGENARWKREKLPNPVELQLKHVTHCDICIVGGGAAGVAAAYALRDSGYHVVLVEQLGSLGGTHTNAGVLQLLASPAPDFLRDICEEAVTEGYAKWHTSNNSIGSDDESEFLKLWRGGSLSVSQGGNAINVNPWYMSQRYMTDLSPSIDVRCNRKFVSAQETDGVIESITCEHLLAGGKETIYAHYFIDCSADGVLARNGKELDEDFYIGSDAKALYNEAALPEGFVGSHYDINSLEPTYMYRKVVGDNVEYTKPDFRPVSDVTGHKNNAWGVPEVCNHKHWNGDVGVNYHTINATVVSPDHNAKLTATDYVDHGYDYTYAKGVNNAKAHFAVNFNVDAKTLYMGIMPLLAMRETYRIKCDRMLMQSDVETLATSANMADGHYIALSSWYADFHGSTGVNTGSIAFPGVFGIPYECTIPVGRKNMLIACRGFGASHIAASAARLTKTMMCLGWAAGKAVAQARAGWLDDMRNVDVAQLQADCGVVEQMADIEQWFTFG